MEAFVRAPVMKMKVEGGELDGCGEIQEKSPG